MKRKKLKRLKFISFLCFIILLDWLIQCWGIRESLYFDGINAIENNSSYYVTVGSNNDNDNFYEKAKVSKYNLKREKTFEKLYNIGYNSAFFGVALDGDSIIAVGSYEKTDEDHEDQVRRALIVKYDENGNVVFESDFRLLDNSKFTSVFVVDDGYLVTGQSVYMNTKIGSKEGGAVLVKYDKDGNLLWSKTFGSSKGAIFNDLLVLDGFIFAVGTDGYHVGILCKYDMTGNFVTYNDYKYTDDLGFNGITNIGSTIYVSGSNWENESLSYGMIVQYDFDCTYEKQVFYRGEGLIRYNKLITDNHGYIIAIGVISSEKSMNSKTADNFNYDGVVGKYEPSLEEISVVTYGDERDDYFTDIKLVDNNYLIVGYSSYEDGSYLSKFICYSDALKVLGVD